MSRRHKIMHNKEPWNDTEIRVSCERWHWMATSNGEVDTYDGRMQLRIDFQAAILGHCLLDLYCTRDC